MTSVTATSPTVGDQAAIAAIPQRVVAAWAAHDAEAFAEVFTEDGSMILPGLFKKGRGEIGAFMREAFAGEYKGTQVTGDPIEMRFFGPETGLLLTAGGVLAPGEKEVAADRAIRASWLVVKTNDGWQLAAYQNSPR